MTLSTALINGPGKDKRRELDFYPTPPEVTHALMRFLEGETLGTIWEPACGDGAMSDVLKQYCPDVRSSDIRETGYGEGGVDFLDALWKADAIITNPPFNKSQAFIEHALTLAPIVAMLVKSQYWHAKKRCGLFLKHPPAFVLPLTWRPDFMNGSRGGAPTMEVQWTVWIKGRHDTRYRILNKEKAGTSF